MGRWGEWGGPGSVSLFQYVTFKERQQHTSALFFSVLFSMKYLVVPDRSDVGGEPRRGPKVTTPLLFRLVITACPSLTPVFDCWLNKYSVCHGYRLQQVKTY